VTALPLTVPELTIDVEGTPVQQGSMIPVTRKGKTVLVPDNSAALKKWREHVVKIAQARMRLEQWATLDGPSAGTLDFYLARPVSEPRRPRPHVRPDIDKLARAVLDSLTMAKVYVDDSRVVDLHPRKHYATKLIGARIVVRGL
jgi:Holliday junction resolvase RusA-like endonuclease